MTSEIAVQGAWDSDSLRDPLSFCRPRRTPPPRRDAWRERHDHRPMGAEYMIPMLRRCRHFTQARVGKSARTCAHDTHHEHRTHAKHTLTRAHVRSDIRLQNVVASLVIGLIFPAETSPISSRRASAALGQHDVTCSEAPSTCPRPTPWRPWRASTSFRCAPRRPAAPPWAEGASRMSCIMLNLWTQQ